jgi:PAS domain S-box-containing protein
MARNPPVDATSDRPDPTALEQLRESELRFRQLAEHIHEVFYLTSADGSEVLYVNPGYEAIWGRPRDELYRHPQSRLDAIIKEDLVHRRHGPDGYEFSYRIRRPDGTLRWIYDRGFPIRDAAGKVYRIAGIAEDVTARVQLEAESRESAERLRYAQELARLAHIVTGPQGEFLSWSDALPAMIGLPPEAMPRSTREWLERVHPDDRGEFRARARAAARTGEPIRFEYRIAGPKGQWRFVRQATEPIRSPGRVGRVESWFNILQDVTEQRQAEEARRESDRRAEETVRRMNAELESLVAERTAELEAANRELEAYDYSISHDLQAPLNRIRGFSEALLEDQGARLDAAGRDYVRRIVTAAEMMGDMVSAMLRLASWTRIELDREDTDLGALAAAVLHDLAQSQPGRRVQWRISPNLVANADAGLLRAALENLLANAWKFTEKRADALIEVGATDAGTETVFWVRDNGAGFDMAEADELFRPFARLRSSGHFRGSGVGLATVQRIVHRHGGRIWAEAEPGRGATFLFTLAPARAR